MHSFGKRVFANISYDYYAPVMAAITACITVYCSERLLQISQRINGSSKPTSQQSKCYCNGTDVAAIEDLFYIAFYCGFYLIPV